ncbi:MAG: fumarylacetoacetate hydrolase family protein [Chloroflexi bacterium]|nr:fumarylacetoacetate hydrolase family protein [Chloroflexota bacterium]HEV8054843.1 fumarylacetoacetate hydrolase family protein [Candidatus Limnocylindrales bacterium]
MRLLSFVEENAELLGVERGGGVLPASMLDPSIGTMEDLLRDPGAVAGLRRAADVAADRFERDGRGLDGLALLAPIPQPGKVVAIGLNYRDHAAEQGVELPSEPLIFAKFPSSVVGPGAEIRWDPELATEVDYEAELGVVIGRRARRVEEIDALNFVLGYTCVNDVSARNLQFGDRQWTRGKSLDTFCPLGPVLVTADELPDPQALVIRCALNGEVLQASSTAQMVFGVAALVSHCSQSFTLEPGDVIATGTPAGVGVFRTPPRLLADGDEVVVEIEGIGRLVNRCRTEIGAT